MHLVEILLPIIDGAVLRREIKPLRRQLTERLGGVTVFARSPGEGLWDDEVRAVRDEIVVVEIMTATIDHNWWRTLRTELEERLSQKEIVVHAHRMERL